MKIYVLVAIILLDAVHGTLEQVLQVEPTEITTTSETESSGLEFTTPSIEERSGHGHHTHVHVDPIKGFWAKKFAWRPRWVKTWQEKKVYVAVWKRMWGPVVVKEWVPVPKPPPGWIKHDSASYIVKKFPIIK